MAALDDDLSTVSALVVDGNPTSRAVLVGQLRDFGIGTVVQCSRLPDARRQLEYRKFDIVLCEHHFGTGAASGQDLLDDLRRNQLLPFSTVFIMVTAEATYAKVAEAAESALDGYLLKPHSASQLGERLRSARLRKLALQDIFAAIEAEDYTTAARLCLQRFTTRGMFWLYAARVGAELLLRLGRHGEAQTLYEAVVQAKTLPWAKLGVARAQLDGGHMAKATSTLEALIGEEPQYVDAYEVLGRAQLEAGRFDRALENYRLASEMTPQSISRMQSLGMLTYYKGDRIEAEQILDRATRFGIESKMFDCQTLVLLSFVRYETNDRKGLLRCQSDLSRAIERQPDSNRLRRFGEVVDILVLMQNHQLGRALEQVRAMVQLIRAPEFDFEAASNLVSLLAQLAEKAIRLDEVDHVIETLSLRFCSSRPLTDLLAGAAHAHTAYADKIRHANADILQLAENAMAHVMRGDPQATIVALIELARRTLNSKVIDTANGMLQRYAAKLVHAEGLVEQVMALRRDYGKAPPRPNLGDQRRQAGALNLRGPAPGSGLGNAALTNPVAGSLEPASPLTNLSAI